MSLLAFTDSWYPSRQVGIICPEPRPVVPFRTSLRDSTFRLEGSLVTEESGTRVLPIVDPDGTRCTTPSFVVPGLPHHTCLLRITVSLRWSTPSHLRSRKVRPRDPKCFNKPPVTLPTSPHLVSEPPHYLLLEGFLFGRSLYF